MTLGVQECDEGHEVNNAVSHKDPTSVGADSRSGSIGAYKTLHDFLKTGDNLRADIVRPPLVFK